MKVSYCLRAISIVTIILQLFVLLGIGLSLITILNVAQAVSRNDALKVSIVPSGENVNGTINLTITNNGFLDTLVKIKVKAMSSSGEVLIERSGEKRISYGKTENILIPFSIPSSTMKNIEKLEVTFEIRTFYDLVGISVSLPLLIGGG